MFGLAAIAAVAAMAFVGASSAMATFPTQLCSSNEGGALTCSAGNVVTHVHFVDSAAKLLTNVLNVTCNALFLGDSLGLAQPLLVHGEFTYSGCNNGCTAEDLEGGLLLILKTAANLAEVKGDGFKVNVHCLNVIECEYDGQGLVGHGLGANLPTTAGEVSISEQTVHSVGGLLCPSTAKLDALFESLTDVYIKS